MPSKVLILLNGYLDGFKRSAFLSCDLIILKILSAFPDLPPIVNLPSDLISSSRYPDIFFCSNFFSLSKLISASVNTLSSIPNFLRLNANLTLSNFVPGLISFSGIPSLYLKYIP